MTRREQEVIHLAEIHDPAGVEPGRRGAIHLIRRRVQHFRAEREDMKAALSTRLLLLRQAGCRLQAHSDFRNDAFFHIDRVDEFS